MSDEKPHILIVEDDDNARRALDALVRMEGYSTDTAASLDEARRQLAKRRPDLILSDLMLPDGRGLDLLAEVQDVPDLDVILITGQASVETATEALRLGAFDYFTKPLDKSRLKTLLHSVTRTRDLRSEVTSLRAELRDLGRFGAMVGISPPMQRVYDLLEKGAPTDAAVMLMGESGTGKEVAARTLHQLSRRQAQALVALNCGAVSATLIESQLFGHERGAFTGAERRHQGVFEQADGGTLFLDEFTEMPLELQVKLLRVLETGRLRRLGARDEIEVDVRVLAATNRDPEQAVEDGLLREDLLYRLKVFPIELPPLRERGEDLELLALHFVAQLSREAGVRKNLSAAALEALQRYPWPGNVRELRNVLRRAFILAERSITVEHLLAEVTDSDRPPLGDRLRLRVGMSIEEAERRLIEATLEHLDGDKPAAAEMLGISLKTLYNRLKRYSDGDEPNAA